MGQRGHSKDHRPDLKQMVVGMVLDQNGNPLCSELWPGNTADVKSLVPIVERLKKRFGIGSVSIVADRGMISAETLAEVEKREWKYILGVRMRSSTEAKAVVARASAVMRKCASQKRRPGRSLAAEGEEVWVEDARRYVVCVNEDQATKDRHDREAVVASRCAAALPWLERQSRWWVTKGIANTCAREINSSPLTRRTRSRQKRATTASGC